MTNRACREVSGFSDLLYRYRRNLSILGRSERTYDNYSRHIAAITLHFKCLPTKLDPEQVQDYLFGLQQRSKTPSETYFKHTVYGLRSLLKSEGLSYQHLKLPSVPRAKRLPVVLSREEVWRMLTGAKLLKHRILIGLLYGCGLRCMEVRNIELRHLDFHRKLLHIERSKGKKDRYVPLSKHLIRGIKTYLETARPRTYLFEGTGNPEGKGFDGRYSGRGVQWAVKSIAKQVGIRKKVNVHIFRHTYATHLLEDGVNILTVQKLLGHANVRTTMIYLHICTPPEESAQSPLDKVFLLCSRSGK